MNPIIVRFAYKEDNEVRFLVTDIETLRDGHDCLVDRTKLLGQDLFTGLRDKYNANLFENDIVMWQDLTYPAHKEFWRVWYDQKQGKFVFGISAISITNPNVQAQITKVGDIYRDPELVTEKERNYCGAMKEVSRRGENK